jgi:hypothetical protein
MSRRLPFFNVFQQREELLEVIALPSAVPPVAEEGKKKKGAAKRQQEELPVCGSASAAAPRSGAKHKRKVCFHVLLRQYQQFRTTSL